MIKAIEPFLRKAKKQNKTIFFRIHESGDFYSQEYFDKWSTIARHFKSQPIVFLAYTKSIDYVPAIRPDNFKIIFSMWNDSKQSSVIEAKRRRLPVYRVFEKTQPAEKVFECKCLSCGDCKKCYEVKDNEIIGVKLH